MFGLSKEEKLSSLIETACRSELHVYEEKLATYLRLIKRDEDEGKIVTDEKIDEYAHNARNSYFYAVERKVVPALNLSPRTDYMFQIDRDHILDELGEKSITASLNAGMLFDSLMRSVYGKKADSKYYYNLSRMQNDLMNSVMMKFN